DFVEHHYRWVATHVPAFKPEPYMTAIHDFVSKINFELAYVKFPNKPIEPYLGNWSDINKTMVEHSNFGMEVTGNGFLKKQVEPLVAGTSSPEEMIAAIVNYVKQTVAWDGNSRMI